MRRPKYRARTAARMLAAIVAAPGAAWAIGVNWIYCMLIASVCVAGVAVLELPALGDETYWPPLDESQRGGGRREVSSLSWLLTSRRDGADRAAVLRLAEVARRRLALEGVDLNLPADRERAVAALGSRVHAMLTEGPGRSPTHSMVTECIDALESLDRPTVPSRLRGSNTRR